MDPSTDTVIIDDELAAGFEKLERAVADKPAIGTGAGAGGTSGADAATQGSSAFSFQGGPRYTPILLGVVLPFAWLAVLYFALSNLLSEHALDRGAAEQTQTQIQELERELQSLRSEISGAPRTAKTKPQRKSKPAKAKPAAVSGDAVRAVAPSDEDEDEDVQDD
ncbi:hypothetical protein DB30_02103 [Enhygromyxa salina]|uniref:Uncharacterized protein n=1 Tax=Enhygromyxa salina TaxID=215803 RepID=A0A0C1ZM86_9BACT|nr:hypothetical protein [Enhygromyxa salina]KIG12048.1 hypothetical protein DB30_02103 [Enhygromyxa salina]